MTMYQFLEAAGIALGAIWANKLRSFLTVLGNIVAVTSIIAVVSLVQGMNEYVTDAIVSGVGADNFTIQRMPVDPDAGRRGPRAQQPAHHAGGSGRDPAVQRQHRRDLGRRPTPAATMSLPDRVGRRRAGHGRLARLHQLLHLRRRARPADQPGRDRDAAGPSPSSAGTSPTSCSAPVDPHRQDDLDRRRALPRRRRAQEEGIGLRQLAGQLRDHPARQLPEDVRLARCSACSCWSSRGRPRSSRRRWTMRRWRCGSSGGCGRRSRTTSACSRPTRCSASTSTATNGIFAVLIGVVALSLVVGGIVIMNIMLMVVSERTREIGLRKALGARRRDIVWQILTESVTLSTFGGIVGTVLGFDLRASSSARCRRCPRRCRSGRW